jgi:hypothetical protein
MSEENVEIVPRLVDDIRIGEMAAVKWQAGRIATSARASSR